MKKDKEQIKKDFIETLKSSSKEDIDFILKNNNFKVKYKIPFIHIKNSK